MHPVDQGTTRGPVSTPVRPAADTVAETGAYDHVRALQGIADDNGSNRASPSPGYDASVDYVVGVLRDAGYDVTTPPYTDANSDTENPIRNVIARSRTGDPSKVVLAGAHLGSVPAGPGIVDNGSGVAALLEIATKRGTSAPAPNQLVFAFWGSEENGAVGSAAWVGGLSNAERDNIRLYLNILRPRREGQRHLGIRPRRLREGRRHARRPARPHRSYARSDRVRRRRRGTLRRSRNPRRRCRERRHHDEDRCAGHSMGERPAPRTAPVTTPPATRSTTSTGPSWTTTCRH